MPFLRLESEQYGTIALNEVFTTGKGMEARSGVAGLGLPPVSVQWREGAGDGATFRSKRLLSRDIDIPLYVKTDDREALKAELTRLALVVRDEVTIRLVEDDGTSWYTKAYRTGGGDYVYGEDTIGVDDLLTVLTFRAGSPYWTYSKQETSKLTNAASGRGLLNGALTKMKVSDSSIFGVMKFDNNGDSDSYPVWTITGPGDNFTATAPDGSTFGWNGSIFGNEIITIDTETGLVKDQTGANRYADLLPAPRLWKVPPGTSEATVTMQNPASGGYGRTGRTRTNLCVNPSMEVDLTQYTNYGGYTPVTFEQSADRAYVGTKSLKMTSQAGDYGWKGVRYTLPTPLVIGETYYFSVASWCPDGVPQAHSPYFYVQGKVSQSTRYGDWFVHNVTWKATSTQPDVWFFHGYSSESTNPVPLTFSTYWDALYISTEDEMGPYFDGSTAWESDGEYEWTGVAGSSTSVRYETGVLGASAVECSYRPRKHLVI